MDKSRSSRNYQSFEQFKKNKSEEQLPIISDKNKVSVNQKKEKMLKKVIKVKAQPVPKVTNPPKKIMRKPNHLLLPKNLI